MKRERVLCLAAALGMSLLIATRGAGDDKNVKVKKPDDKKPAVKAVKPAVNTPKIVINKPASKPVSSPANKDTAKVTQSNVTAKPAANVKPAGKTTPTVNAKPAPRVIPSPKAPVVSNVKPLPNTKPATNAKNINTNPTIRKPVEIAKPAVDRKVPSIAKSQPAIVKPSSNSNVKTATSKPIASRSIVQTKPASTLQVASKSKDSKPTMAKETEIKKPVINRLVMIKSANMTASKVGTAPVFSIPIPSEYEKIGLSNEQRDKVRSIVNRYDVQIQNMETLLNSMKTNRAKELSNVLTSKQQSELANGKTPVPSQAKPEVKRSNTSKNDKTVASVAPASKGNTASKDKGIKKAEGKK